MWLPQWQWLRWSPPPTFILSASFLVMSKHDGILLMICSRLLQTTALSSTISLPTKGLNFIHTNWTMMTGKLLGISYEFWRYIHIAICLPASTYSQCCQCAHQVYKDATLFFSQDTVVTIAHVVLTMDCIDVVLSNSATMPLTAAVKHALSFAHWLMDKYYSKTDFLNVYHIAMDMSPFFVPC